MLNIIRQYLIKNSRDTRCVIMGDNFTKLFIKHESKKYKAEWFTRNIFKINLKTMNLENRLY